ncbi:UNVERIFIED_CONTAM: protein TRANSPARENT TESTA 9 [Sesamum radiatum]|uniref:Protein TRANSPARENT TESTA 9 n=1 Tax=Sesamum radiatum TaxID=300843 RepID=A0AAW2KPJ9_SESRA
MKVQTVNDVNKDFVIEALRSIAELITYGDQHDNAYFEFFMEKQVMGEFVRILKTSRTLIISLQLLQTMSIMIQNLKNEHAIFGDDAVNRFVSRAPHADYFLNLVKFFRDQCIHLNLVVSNASKNLGVESTSTILSAVDEIEDNLYYFSDVVSAGIPDVGRLIMDSVLRLLIFPLILPSLRIGAVKEPSLGAVTSLYLLCCILRILKIKDLANTVAAALLYCPDIFPQNSEAELNGNMLGHGSSDAASQYSDENNCTSESDARSSELSVLTSSSSLNHPPNGVPGHDCGSAQFAPSGDDVQVSGSLSVLATLLQTKELDESMVDALGILPQRKQHKKKLLVLDALVSLFCRSNISAETLWDGGWLLRQLLPYSEAEFNSRHLRLLKDSFRNCTNHVIEETRGTWSDLLVTTICDEWRKCKRAIEASSPRKDPKFVLLPPNKSASDENASCESSIAAGERMCETVKVFVLLHHLHIFSLGRVLPDQPPVFPTVDIPENSRAKNADLNPPELNQTLK